MTYDMVEGSQAPETFRLEDDGSAISGSGLSAPDLIIHDRHGRQLTVTAGTVSWLSASGGTITVLKGNLGLTQQLSPYRVRFKLTDANSRPEYYPNGKEPDIWRIFAP